jgi:uncharacterized protein (DUF58 family)
LHIEPGRFAAHTEAAAGRFRQSTTTTPRGGAFRGADRDAGLGSVSESKNVVGAAGRFLSYDFCPWANAYVYWLKKPLGWFIAALAATLLLAVAVSPQAYYVAAGLALIILIGSLWPWLGLVGVSGQLRWIQQRVVEGEPVVAELELTNRGFWPVFGLLLEMDPALTPSPGQPVALSYVPPLGVSRFRWTSQPRARGHYPQQPVQVVTGFPFGLWHARRRLHVRGRLIVWPATFPLDDMPPLPGDSRAATGAFTPQSGHEGDWLGVRPYREGDSLRQVHWAQTARRDELIVCERQSTSRQELLLWLDAAMPPGCPPENGEWMVRTAAAIVSHLVHHQWSVTVALDGERTQVHPTGNSLPRWLDLLAAWRWPPPASRSEVEPSPVPVAGRSPFMIGLIASERLTKLSGSGALAGSGLAPQRAWVIFETAASASELAGSPMGGPADRASAGAAEALVGNAGLAGRSGRDRVWMQLELSDALPEQARRAWQRVCSRSMASVG